MAIRRVDKMLDKQNAIYVTQDEKLYEIEGPSTGFGSTKIITQHGKIVRVETTTSEFFPKE